jgi:hypothetical protein
MRRSFYLDDAARGAPLGAIRWLGVVALGLMPACSDDGMPDGLVPDGARLGELSASEMRSLCNEVASGSAAEAASCARPSSYAELQTNPAPCEGLQASACDVTAGEFRACQRAVRASPCGDSAEAAAACAPFLQRGCAATGSPIASDSCPDLGASVAPFEGIYEIVEHTRNDAGCDAEGASVIADEQPLFIVVTLLLFGSPAGRLESCGDIEACRTAADELRRYSRRIDSEQAPPQRSESLVCHATQQGALASNATTYRSSEEGPGCPVEATQETISRGPGGTLRVEKQTFVFEAPFHDDGSCSSASTDGDPQGAPCSGLEVYEARLVSEL